MESILPLEVTIGATGMAFAIWIYLKATKSKMKRNILRDTK